MWTLHTGPGSQTLLYLMYSCLYSCSSDVRRADDSQKSWLCFAWTLGWWWCCVNVTTKQLVFINIHSSKACEAAHLKSESVWQEDSGIAAIGWHCYSRLVHHKPPSRKRGLEASVAVWYQDGWQLPPCDLRLQGDLWKQCPKYYQMSSEDMFTATQKCRRNVSSHLFVLNHPFFIFLSQTIAKTKFRTDNSNNKVYQSLVEILQLFDAHETLGYDQH